LNFLAESFLALSWLMKNFMFFKFRATILASQARKRKFTQISFAGRDILSARYDFILNVIFEVFSKYYDEKTIEFIEKVAEAIVSRSNTRAKGIFR